MGVLFMMRWFGYDEMVIGCHYLNGLGLTQDLKRRIDDNDE